MRGTLRISVLAVVSTALAAGACTDAGGEVSGGTARFDTTPAAAGCAITEPDLSKAGDTTWKGIYRDFFGCRSTSSCAGSGACHDNAKAPGARQSNFVCSNPDECYRSITTAKDVDPRYPKPLVEPATDTKSPDSAYLFSVITYRTRDGQLVPNRGMPQLPRDFAYAPEQIDRMKAWIAAGAKND